MKEETQQPMSQKQKGLQETRMNNSISTNWTTQKKQKYSQKHATHQDQIQRNRKSEQSGKEVDFPTKKSTGPTGELYWTAKVLKLTLLKLVLAYRQTCRPMEQKRKPRKSTHMWSTELQ